MFEQTLQWEFRFKLNILIFKLNKIKYDTNHYSASFFMFLILFCFICNLSRFLDKFLLLIKWITACNSHIMGIFIAAQFSKEYYGQTKHCTIEDCNTQLDANCLGCCMRCQKKKPNWMPDSLSLCTKTEFTFFMHLTVQMYILKFD